MPVQPQVAAFLSTLPPSTAVVPDLVVWRADGEAHVPSLAERTPAMAEVRDCSVPAGVLPGSAAVPVRVYTPPPEVRDGAADPPGLIIFLHGGAFFSGSLDTHDGLARALAAASGFIVLAVGYRLAPEHAFPAGLDDCRAVLAWAAAHRAELGAPGERLVLAGDSSGGTFAAVLAADAHDERLALVSDQLLLYPSVDLDFDEARYPSLRENARGYGLETVGLKPHNSFYLASGADPGDPRVSPIKRESLSGLPRALVITAEFDPLRDEGEAYAARLAEEGVPVQVLRVPGATHGFLQHFGWIPEFTAVFDEIGEWLRAGART